MILDHGKLLAYGDIDDVAPIYEKMIEEREDELPKKKKKKSDHVSKESKKETKDVKETNCRMMRVMIRQPYSV